MISKFRNRLARLSLLALAGLWLLGGMVQADVVTKEVYLVVTVPANAKLYIDEVITNATGEVRKFISDKVPVGKKYSYKIKAVWPGPDGKDIVRETKFVVIPGTENALDLTKPVEAPKPVAKLTVKTPDSLTVEAGTKKPINVKISRENFKEPVKVTVAGLPEGVKAPELTLEGDKLEGDLEISLPKESKGGDSGLTVKAEGAGLKAESKLKLTVKSAPPPPPPPAKLSLEAPQTIELKAGGTAPVVVKVKRENFKGPVKLTLAGLPAGVTVGEVVLAEDKNEASVELKAAKDANAATADVTVKGDASAKAETKFKLVVKANEAPAVPKDTPKDTPKPPEKKQ